jgi:hypothetical protein
LNDFDRDDYVILASAIYRQEQGFFYWFNFPKGAEFEPGAGKGFNAGRLPA